MEKDISFYTVKAENRQFEEAQSFLSEVLKLHFGEKASSCTLKKVQLAGTNGKGSTAAMLSSVLKHAGYKTGLYTSPSLICVNERIRLNGEMISDATLCSYIPVITKAQENIGRLFGGFERITAASMLYYLDNNVDIAIMETGLGGRYDTVSGVEKLILSSITSIGMDHMVMLGDSIDKIAWEKCGIMRQGIPTVSHTQCPEAEDMIRRCAAENDSKLIPISECSLLSSAVTASGQSLKIRAEGEVYDLEIGLHGEYQIMNAMNALLCALELRKQGFNITKQDIEQGFSEAHWDGRLQKITIPDIQSPVILDGAHNPHAMKAVADHVTKTMPDKKFTLLLSVMADKDIDGILCEAKRFADKAVCVKITERSCEPEKLADMVRKHGMTAVCADSVEDGLRAASELSGGETVFVLGSLYLVGKILGL